MRAGSNTRLQITFQAILNLHEELAWAILEQLELSFDGLQNTMNKEIVAISYRKIIMHLTLVFFSLNIGPWKFRNMKKREFFPNGLIKFDKQAVLDLCNIISITSNNMRKNSTSKGRKGSYFTVDKSVSSSSLSNWIISKLEIPFLPINSSNSGSGGNSST